MANEEREGRQYSLRRAPLAEPVGYIPSNSSGLPYGPGPRTAGEADPLGGVPIDADSGPEPFGNGTDAVYPTKPNGAARVNERQQASLSNLGSTMQEVFTYTVPEGYVLVIDTLDIVLVNSAIIPPP